MDRANEVLLLGQFWAPRPLDQRAARGCCRQCPGAGAGQRSGVHLARCSAESALTSALEATFTDPQVVDELMEQPDGQRIVNDLTATIQKAAWSRRFHNDAVRATVAVRQQRLVRLLRLAGSATLPHTVELDDEVPPALRTLTFTGLGSAAVGLGTSVGHEYMGESRNSRRSPPDVPISTASRAPARCPAGPAPSGPPRPSIAGSPVALGG